MSKAKKIKELGLKNNLSNPYEDREGLVYSRVSSVRQTTEGSGLESQEGRCMKELKNLNVPYVKTFPDSFSGGGDFMNRPAMRELLEYIDTHPHKRFVVIFDDLSRFARDVYFHIKLRAEFKKRDVILKCLNYNFDESEEGEFAELVFAGKAELDRKQNRRQVIQKQKSRLELGYWAFGSKRGYKMTRSSEHGTVSIPIESEASILKEALEGFASGTFLRKIDVCNFLVEKRFWKKQKPEKYIDKLVNIMKDPFYAGFIEYSQWEVQRRIGKHKGIISSDTFELIQKRLKKEDTGQRIRIDTSADFPLRGLLVCADCGESLTGALSSGRSKKYPYYFCQNKECCSCKKSIKKEDVEKQFETILKQSGMKEDISPFLEVFERVWSEEIDKYKKSENVSIQQKKVLEGKIEELTDLMINSKTDLMKKTYENQIEKTAKEIEGINSNSIKGIDLSIPYRTATEKAIGLLKNPYDIWVSLDVLEQHRIFYFLFDEKLPYSKTEGYRTAQIRYAIRTFEEFSTPSFLDVEMAGIEPACKKKS